MKQKKRTSSIKRIRAVDVVTPKDSSPPLPEKKRPYVEKTSKPDILPSGDVSEADDTKAIKVTDHVKSDIRMTENALNVAYPDLCKLTKPIARPTILPPKMRRNDITSQLHRLALTSQISDV